MALIKWHGFIGGLFLAASIQAEVLLPKILSDGMVLQSGIDAPIWGKAAPGETITVQADWQRRALSAVADRNGRWLVKLRTPRPGGPHVLTIKGSNEIVLRDVLVGEVWICSGQSNMEMPVGSHDGYTGVTNWPAELQQADFPNIRLFTVPNGFATSPRFDCDGRWQPCTAESASRFSASAFFFGRPLHRELNVPIGLISADFGGTVAEAWTSEATLQTMPDFQDALKLVAMERDEAGELARMRAGRTSDWLQRVEPLDGGDANAANNLDDASWKTIDISGAWTGDLAGFDGFVWLRREFYLPSDWAGKDLVLDLGPIDDMDFTFVNGTRIGQTVGENSWSVPRVYSVPRAVLRSGRNLIAIRVLDTGGPGGVSGPVQLRSGTDTESLSLDRGWRYQTGLQASALPSLVLPARVHANTPSVLFNAMIAPLVPFGIRGAIWYQGESNIGRDEQYRRLFPALIGDWRRHWGQGDFPFYYVQIAPFRYPNSGMAAALREAQLLSLRTPGTGMAVTMDSDASNLHPLDKQKVGHRLALWALAKTYGRKKLVYSGPLYRAMKIEGDRVRLFFDCTGSGLIPENQSLEHFTVAGADGRFVPAQAEIDGRTILVSSDAVHRPVAVRYCWADDDESSFGNREGLPASSFATDAAGR